MPLIKDRARRAMGSFSQKLIPSSSTIRVLKIKKGTPEFPIRLKIKAVDSRTAKYIALSYAHGSSQKSTQGDAVPAGSSGAALPTILCDGKEVRVSQALWDVIDQLRRLETDVPVWIDQLCIDFGNKKQRAAQVDMMGSIYGNASHVIVWLGRKTKGTDDTLLCMRKLVNAIDWRKIPRDFVADFSDPITYARFGMDRISTQQWSNIYDFCHGDWFSRLWPFFELASAKQAMFLIGDSFMDYDFLMDFAMVLGLTGWLERLSQMATDGYDEESVGLTKMLGPVATLRSIPIWHPHHPDFTKWMRDEHNLNTEEEMAWMFFELLLQYCERFECRDQRDRVFATLAYVKRVFVSKMVNNTWPNVDYTLTGEVVFSHFANRILKNTRKPSILAAEEYQQVQPTLARDNMERGRTGRRIPLD